MAALLLGAALAACAGGRDASGSRSAPRAGASLTLPQKGMVELLARAPDLGWHRGGWYAFVDAPGNRAVVLFSGDGGAWEQFALIDRAGQVYGAVFTNPADGYILHGNTDGAILYRASFLFGNRTMTPAARLAGRYVRLLPDPNPNDSGAPALLILGSDGAGHGVVLRTTDGSKIESIAHFEGAAPALVADLARFRDRTFLVGGSGGVGAVYESRGGAPFRKISPDEIPNILGIDFDTAGHGIAVGSRGEVLRTSDGGDHWEASLSGTEADLADVRFVGDGRAFVCGRGGTLLFTSDGGATFRPLALGRRDDFFGLVPAPSGDGVYILGAAGIIPFVGIGD